MTKTYKISEVAAMTGLSIPTLRYYETLGLLKPVRQENNYRLFTDKELNWIEFIKRAKATGMPLAKIMTYAKLREPPRSSTAAITTSACAASPASTPWP